MTGYRGGWRLRRHGRDGASRPAAAGGAADGWVVNCRLVAAAPGAMCAGGRVRTCRSKQVDMAGGLGMAGGQVCDAARLGPAWLCSGTTLQYSTFRSLSQGMAGRDQGIRILLGEDL